METLNSIFDFITKPEFITLKVILITLLGCVVCQVFAKWWNKPVQPKVLGPLAEMILKRIHEGVWTIRNECFEPVYDSSSAMFLVNIGQVPIRIHIYRWPSGVGHTYLEYEKVKLTSHEVSVIDKAAYTLFIKLKEEEKAKLIYRLSSFNKPE